MPRRQKKRQFNPITFNGDEAVAARSVEAMAVYADEDKRDAPENVTVIGLNGPRTYKFRVPKLDRVGPKRRKVLRVKQAIWWDSVRGLEASAFPQRGALNPEFEDVQIDIPWPAMRTEVQRRNKWAEMSGGDVVSRSGQPRSYVESVLGSDSFFLPVPVVLNPRSRHFQVVNPYWMNNAIHSESVTEFFSTFNKESHEVLQQMIGQWQLNQTEEQFVNWANQTRSFRTPDGQEVMIPFSFWLTPIETPNGQVIPRFVAAAWQFRHSDNRDQYNQAMSIYLGPTMDDMIQTFLKKQLPRGIQTFKREQQRQRETIAQPWLTEIEKINRDQNPAFTPLGITNFMGAAIDAGELSDTVWADIQEMRGGSRALTMLGLRLQQEEIPHQMRLVYTDIDQHGNPHASLDGALELMSTPGGEESVRLMTVFDPKLEKMVAPYMNTSVDQVVAEAGLDFRHRVGLPITRESVLTQSPELIPAFNQDTQDDLQADRQSVAISALPLAASGVRLTEGFFGAPGRRQKPKPAFREVPRPEGEAKPRPVTEAPTSFQALAPSGAEGDRGDTLGAALSRAQAQGRLVAPELTKEDMAIIKAMEERFVADRKSLDLEPAVDFGDKKNYRGFTDYLDDVVRDTPRIREDYQERVAARAERRFSREYGAQLRAWSPERRVHMREQYVRGVLAKAPEPNVLDVAIRKLKGLGPAQWAQGAGGIVSFGAEMGWWDRNTARQVNEMITSQRTIEMGSNIALGTLRTFAIVRKNQDFLQRRQQYLNRGNNFGWNRTQAYTGQAFSLASGFAAAEGKEDLAGGLGAVGGALQGFSALRPFGTRFGVGGGLLLGALGFFTQRFRGRRIREAGEERDRRAADRAARQAAFDAERARIQQIREADFASRSLRLESRSLAVRIARGAATRADQQNLSRFFRRPQFASSVGLVGDVERRAARQFRPRF